MWLFTQFGFYSIVQDKQDAGRMQVRSRERRDLENFGKVLGWSDNHMHTAIIETRGADYQWRIGVSRSDVAIFQQRVLDGLDYHNFKSQIAQKPDQRHKSHALHEVWDAMSRLQQCRPYSKVLRDQETQS